jgi:hypothetical protein
MEQLQLLQTVLGQLRSGLFDNLRMWIEKAGAELARARAAQPQ